MTSEEDKVRFQVARNGDHLMILFQCELCHFRNLKGLDPGKGDADIRLLRTIRRATLDAFWAREPSTVEATRRDSKKIVEISQSLGLDDTLPEFRRGSNSEALNRGVDEATIDRNNRWRKIEKAGARKANLSMRDHYAEVLVSLRSFLKYSQAL